MVAQVFAYAGQVVDHGDAHFPQMSGRAYAGEQQDLGRGDGAAGEDDPVAIDFKDVAAAFGGHAHGLFAVKEDAADHHAAAHGQVEAVAGH